MEHAHVYGRLVKGEGASILPKTPEVFIDGQCLVLSDGSLGKKYELDGCFDSSKEWTEIVNISSTLIDKLSSGHTFGIIGLGIGYYFY